MEDYKAFPDIEGVQSKATTFTNDRQGSSETQNQQNM